MGSADLNGTRKLEGRLLAECDVVDLLIPPGRD
jgi:hypothetical protein